MPASSRLHGERGFTLIEVLVSMLILLVGIAGAIALIDGAAARTVDNKEREAGNALAREVIESARSVPYRQLTPTTTISTLQALPALDDTTPSTTAWTVERRNQTYTITVSVCSIDDTQDGVGDTTGGNFCAANAAGPDANPDDYKRLTVRVEWTRGTSTRNVTQTGIVNNEASSAGPSVEFTNQTPGGLATTEITSPPGLANINFDVQAQTGATGIRFAVDGVLLDSATTTTATFTWKIDGGGTHVPDGTYLVSVTAFDAEATPGPTRSRTIRLNRDVPSAPGDVFGGFNPRAWATDANDIVEIQWARNNEPDVSGYRVYRNSGSGDSLVPGCDKPATPDFTYCRDMNPPATATTDYFIVALDQDPSTGNPREGARTKLTATRAATRPNQPASLSAIADDDSVLLQWADAPPVSPGYSGSNVIFYRIYRDGVTLADRVGKTGQDSLTSFKDIGELANNHVYFVTTVDENFSESLPLGPVAVP
jgi:prepilin-type N-terminal cleavage/methylation domain-containing protein